MEDSSEGSLEYGIFYGDMLFAMPPVKDPIIDHILYERDVICISSAPGVGKSVLALQLMANLTTGSPFMDTYNIPYAMDVLYVQTEGDRAETLERIQMMQYGVKINHNKWAHLNLAGTSLNVKDTFKEIEKQIASAGMYFGVIIIDPLYTTVKGTLNSDEVATDWIRNIRELKANYGCAVIVLHHDGKEIYHEGVPVDRGSNVTFGSVFWQAFYNHNFKLKRKKDTWTLECGKQRSGKIVDKIDMVMMSPKPLMYTMVTDETDSTRLILRNYICTAGQPISFKQIIKDTGIPQTTVHRSLKTLLKSSAIDRTHDTTQWLYHKMAIKASNIITV